MTIALHVIRLTPEESAVWHSADVRVWAPYRAAWRRRLVSEAWQRRAQVELQDRDGEPLDGRLPPVCWERLPDGSAIMALDGWSAGA